MYWTLRFLLISIYQCGMWLTGYERRRTRIELKRKDWCFSSTPIQWRQWRIKPLRTSYVSNQRDPLNIDPDFFYYFFATFFTSTIVCVGNRWQIDATANCLNLSGNPDRCQKPLHPIGEGDRTYMQQAYAARKNVGNCLTALVTFA